MDYDKYYKIDHDGTYILHFANKSRLSENEIRKIFSNYGKVLYARCLKNDETGFAFVKYKTLEEIITCLKGLNGSEIQLLPERSKMNNLDKRLDRKDLSQPQAARNSFKRLFNNDKQLNSNSVHDKNLPSEENSVRMRTSNENNFMNTNYQNSSQPQAAGNSFKRPLSDDKQLNSNSIHDKNLPSEENSIHRTSNENNFMNTSYQDSMHKPNLNIMRGTNKLDLSIFNEKSPLSSRQQTSMETNLHTTINYEKYYKICKDKSYSVHFANKKKLTDEEINDLFSLYGEVLSINNAGGANGLKIIRYRTLEEVIRCIKDLQNNIKVSLLPQKERDKIADETKMTDQRSSNPRQAAGMEDTSQRTFSSDRQFNPSSTRNERVSDNGEKIIHNRKTFDLDKVKESDCSSDTASRSSRQSYTFNENEIKYKNAYKYKNTSSQMANERYSFSRQQNPANNEGYNQMREKQQKTKFFSSIKNEIDSKTDGNVQIGMDDYKIPALVFDAETRSSESDVVSDSLLSSGTKNSSSKIVHIPMQEVIVANIHSNYGVHYILHMFEKYDPISATLVKTSAESSIRYCHIYFKTVQDAVAVEEEFDNFDLSGKNLIVLRKSRLIDRTK